MAKFKYRMQNVLDIKQKLEEAAKMEFAQANMQVRLLFLCLSIQQLMHLVIC